jgi:hypothetical protein
MGNMTVKVFKLISGEELIASVTSGSDAGYHVENAATIMLQQTEKGIGVGLAPYMPYAEDEKVYLFKHAIASEGTPAVAMRNEYSRMFGSGIEIAPASALYTG